MRNDGGWVPAPEMDALLSRLDNLSMLVSEITPVLGYAAPSVSVMTPSGRTVHDMTPADFGILVGDALTIEYGVYPERASETHVVDSSRLNAPLLTFLGAFDGIETDTQYGVLVFGLLTDYHPTDRFTLSGPVADRLGTTGLHPARKIIGNTSELFARVAALEAAAAA